MKFFDLKDISERYMDLLNPSTLEKMLKIGEVGGLAPGQRVIDFGCGFGEVLVLWAERFGISGVGIDVRPYACERARRRVAERGLADRIEIACGNAAEYPFAPGAWDLAACIGASFIWGGWRPTIQAMRRAIGPGGRLMIGEPYWLTDSVPPAAMALYAGTHSEVELLQIAHAEGLEFEYIVRASHDDWDRYESDDWRGLLQWLGENPDHPERQQVLDHLHQSQDDYLRYGRGILGWAVYLLSPTR